MAGGLNLRHAPHRDFHRGAIGDTKSPQYTPRALQCRHRVPDGYRLYRLEGAVCHEHGGASPNTDQVVWRALELLLVLLELASGHLDRAIVQSPDARLPRPIVAVADDLGGTLDEAEGFLVRAAQNEGSVVRRERQANLDVRLATASLPAVEKLVGLAEIRIGLWSEVRHPARGACDLARLDQRVLQRVAVHATKGSTDSVER